MNNSHLNKKSRPQRNKIPMKTKVKVASRRVIMDLSQKQKKLNLIKTTKNKQQSFLMILLLNNKIPVNKILIAIISKIIHS